jgi:hypothetical protein
LHAFLVGKIYEVGQKEGSYFPSPLRRKFAAFIFVKHGIYITVERRQKANHGKSREIAYQLSNKHVCKFEVKVNFSTLSIAMFSIRVDFEIKR